MSIKSAATFEMGEKELRIQLNGGLNADNLEQLQAEMAIHLFKNVVIECAEIPKEVVQQAGRVLARMARDVRRVDKNLELKNASIDLMGALKTQGTFGLFAWGGIEDESARVSPGKLDVSIINPFLATTMNVIQTQTSVSLKCGTPFKKGATDELDGEVHGFIQFDSKNVKGIVCISFPKDTLNAFLAKILGEAKQFSEKEISSGAGELLNVIFTQTKAVLNKDGNAVKPAVPKVMMDKTFPSTSGFTYKQRFVIPFSTDIGAFSIEVLAA